MIRRIAVHKVVIEDDVIHMCVLEIDNDGVVRSYKPFEGELPFTEWVGGTVVLVKDECNRLVMEKYGNS